MISLIICSRTPKISEELEKNIAETIGCEYELVVIDNSKNKYFIFSAYNEGIRRAKGDILCFMHDDILYKTTKWGALVEKQFKDDDTLGCVGVLGAYCLDSGGYWEMMEPYTVGEVYTTQDESMVYNKNYYEESSETVAAVDGLWFCIKSNLFGYQIEYDDKNYTGFHWYDMDICMQIITSGYTIKVNKKIIIKHLNRSRYTDIFFDNMDIFYRKWNQYLPIWRGLKPDEVILKAIKSRNMHQRLLQTQVNSYQTRYYSVLNSMAFKIGSLLLFPFYKLKRMNK